MAAKCTLLVLVLVSTSILSIADANKNWGNGGAGGFWGYSPRNMTYTSNTLVVGGSQNWRFGFNYTDWSIKNAPFFLNDTLGT